MVFGIAFVKGKRKITSLHKLILLSMSELEPQYFKDFRTEFSQMKTSIQKMEKKVDAIGADVSVLKSDVSVLKSDVAILKTDVSVLKSDVSTLKVNVVTLTSDVSWIKDKLEVHFDQIGNDATDITKTNLILAKKADRADVAKLEKRVDVIEKQAFA